MSQAFHPPANHRGTTPRVAVIVLAWNSADCITRCLASVQASTIPLDIIVIDNDSHDTTKKVVTKSFPTVTYRNSGDNLGYAGGNNIGIELALQRHADFVLLLNPDAYVAPDCVERLVSYMQAHPQVGLASPKIYYADSDTIWFAGADINWSRGTSAHIGQGRQDGPEFSHDKLMPRANGCAMLLRASAMETTGLLDEQYFLYFEETEFSVRCAKHGYKAAFVAGAHCWHAVSSSTGGYFTPLYQYYTTRNRLLFMRQHGPGHRLRFALWQPVAICQKLYRTLRCRPRQLVPISRAVAKAYIDFMRGRFGRQRV
jgi:GT2 family glycosyltransferase